MGNDGLAKRSLLAPMRHKWAFPLDAPSYHTGQGSALRASTTPGRTVVRSGFASA